ncbi:RidA family protein [Ramlibacter sp.]|uniref:RidA family protein n=1 Tax=Ramlibacter sp. TaxID=1917967 RepID=UPI003D124B3C
MSKRQSIYLEGFGHVNPIPAACRVGPLLMTGLVNGTDPATGKVAATLEEQTALMFRHIRAIMAAAGGTTDDIVRISVWLKDRSQRGPLNEQWLAMFPDDQDRPARLSVQAGDLSGGILVQCEVTAYIPQSS